MNWIKCSERMPKDTLCDVLCYGSVTWRSNNGPLILIERAVYKAEYELDMDTNTGQYRHVFSLLLDKQPSAETYQTIEHVTHWMSLPEAPVADNEE